MVRSMERAVALAGLDVKTVVYALAIDGKIDSSVIDPGRRTAQFR
jgi:hypothetical protein